MVVCYKQTIICPTFYLATEHSNSIEQHATLLGCILFIIIIVVLVWGALGRCLDGQAWGPEFGSQRPARHNASVTALSQGTETHTQTPGA